MEVLARAAAVIIEPDVRERARARDRGAAPAGDRGRRPGRRAAADRRPGDRRADRRRGAEPVPARVGQGARRRVRRGAQRSAWATGWSCWRCGGRPSTCAAVGGYVAMNVSPATLLTPGAAELLQPAAARAGRCSSCPSTTRSRTTTRCRASSRRCAPRGMRLAIDDVGAGFSSLRHIVITAPTSSSSTAASSAGVSRRPVLHHPGPLAGRLRPRLAAPGWSPRASRRRRTPPPPPARCRPRPGLALRAPRPGRRAADPRRRRGTVRPR